MTELKDYVINLGDRYWAVPHRATAYAAEGRTENVKIWTLTVHEPGCRYTKNTESYSHYSRDEAYLLTLAQNGFAPPASHHASKAWTGCKVCGTAALPNDHWKALGRATLDAQRAAQTANREARESAQRVEQARRDRTGAIMDAQGEHFTRVYKARVDADNARIAAEIGARWDAENPEQAALLHLEATG